MIDSPGVIGTRPTRWRSSRKIVSNTALSGSGGGESSLSSLPVSLPAKRAATAAGNSSELNQRRPLCVSPAARIAASRLVFE